MYAQLINTSYSLLSHTFCQFGLLDMRFTDGNEAKIGLCFQQSHTIWREYSNRHTLIITKTHGADKTNYTYNY